MLAAGLVAEVEALLARGIAPNAPGLDAVGYREVVACLQGRLAPDALAGAIVSATTRYAKRQESWFRHQVGGTSATLDATIRPDQLAESILARWRARER
jgi:tRNA A37 N6-isopentenylltransferase MiaA